MHDVNNVGNVGAQGDGRRGQTRGRHRHANERNKKLGSGIIKLL